MIDYAAWIMADVAILLLIGCAWWNQRNGYSKSAGRKFTARTAADPADHQFTRHLVPEPRMPDTQRPVSRDYEFTHDLMRLQVSLHSEPAPTQVKTAA